jgi:hypothetical protein
VGMVGLRCIAISRRLTRGLLAALQRQQGY